MPDCDQTEAWSSVRACAVPAQSCTPADRGNAPDSVGSKQSRDVAANKPRHSWACAEHQPRVGVPGKDASYDNALECVLGYMARQPSPRELSRGSPGPPLPATFPFPGTQYAIRRATHKYPNRLYLVWHWCWFRSYAFAAALHQQYFRCCRRPPTTCQRAAGRRTPRSVLRYKRTARRAAPPAKQAAAHTSFLLSR